MKEGLYNMNELKRISIIQSVIDKKRTQKEAANALGVSERQIRTLVKRFREEGPNGLKHKNKLNKPSHSFSEDFKTKIIQLKLSDNYIDTNFSHFRDLLEERENIKISYSALYNILHSNNIISKKSHKPRKTHRRRKRKECEGMLVQTDGTPFDWFNIGKKYSLHGYVDDATGKILGLYMCENECLMGYLEITRQMLKNYGSPIAIYSDKYSVFFPTSSQKVTVEEQLQGKEKPTTQFKRIMDVLGVELIAASTSQAKGRIERLWNTLHDRLRTEFRRHNITTIDEANKFLKKYILKYNKKFSIESKEEKSSFMELPKYVNLDYLLSVKYTRTVDVSNCISINGFTFLIETKEILHKKKIELCISKRIGLKVRFNNKWYQITPISNTYKKSLKSNDSVKAIIEQFVYSNCLKNERLSA